MTADDALHVVAEAAEGVRDRNAAAEIGRHLGHATSTVTRRGHLPVLEWSAAEVLRLARHDERLGAAVTAYIAAAPVAPRGDAAALPSDIAREITRGAALASAWVAASADGRLDRAELRRILDHAETLRAAADVLITDVRVALAEARS